MIEEIYVDGYNFDNLADSFNLDNALPEQLMAFQLDSGSNLAGLVPPVAAVEEVEGEGGSEKGQDEHEQDEHEQTEVTQEKSDATQEATQEKSGEVYTRKLIKDLSLGDSNIVLTCVVILS